MNAPFTTVALRVALVAALAVAAGGCQLTDKRKAAETPPAQPGQEETADLSTVVDRLERGETRQARDLLVRLRDQTPDSEVVEWFLHQIDAPVEELVPGPYRRVKVAPGDSLSQIAARELGDPLLFYALARLNGIETPARIPAGTWVRIPASEDAQSNGLEKAPKAGAISAQDVESVAVDLARGGRPGEARRTLTDWLAKSQRAPESTQRLLVEIMLEQVFDFDGKTEQALTLIDEALSVVEADDLRLQLAQARSSLQSRERYRLAQALQSRGELQAAYARATEAVALDPGAQRAKRLAESLEAEVIDLLHSRALVAWRDRDVDRAIRNWASLLEIAPDFEPAKVYIERAKRLRRRLEEP